jgi:hypothetical protein
LRFMIRLFVLVTLRSVPGVTPPSCTTPLGCPRRHLLRTKIYGLLEKMG